MGLPNISLRGSIYWWRRRITVAGHTISLAFSLRTGVFNHARTRAGLLSAEVEKLRMAYGDRGVAIDPQALQKIFSDSMRWQLDRIVSDQVASPGLSAEHARANRVWGELWRFLSVNGPQAKWTWADRERLDSEGWAIEDQNAVALELMGLGETKVSREQLEAYCKRFDIVPSASNLDVIQRIIFRGREAACRQGTKQLEQADTNFDAWAEAALNSREPLVFEPSPAMEEPFRSSAPVVDHNLRDGDRQHASTVGGAATVAATEAARPAPASTQALDDSGSKKLLSEAAEEAIGAHLRAGLWVKDSADQVRTAMRLFQFACGGDLTIEDLTQTHVKAFHKLCADLPNRWGKTKEEIEHGLPASLTYARTLRARGEEQRVGLSPTTVDKHISWIQAVLNHADDDGSEDGHRPARSLRFHTKESKMAAKAENKNQRARDARANWTPKEIERLLAAPIWHGCLNLDSRFDPGPEVFHDAWYWLPPMLVLYGGRSSELAGIPLKDVHESAEIPYFQIDYTDLRRLKNVQSIRNLPIHPELIRLGFIDYVTEMKKLGHQLLFPEIHSEKSKSFATTFYKSVFKPWRSWAFPNGTVWRHEDKGQVKDKDVHSFRGVASSMMQGLVEDSVRFDILGHEGGNTTKKIYDEEAALEKKLAALELISPLTSKVPRHPLRLRPVERQKFGAKRGARPKRPNLRLVIDN